MTATSVDFEEKKQQAAEVKTWNADLYESFVAPIAVYPGQGTIFGLAYTALGVAGEGGEFCDKVKKVLRDDDGVISAEKRIAMLKELGDDLWYIAASARELGSSLNEVMGMNVDKLLGRRVAGTVHGEGDNR